MYECDDKDKNIVLKRKKTALGSRNIHCLIVRKRRKYVRIPVLRTEIEGQDSCCTGLSS